jgi:hypothetical protein
MDVDELQSAMGAVALEAGYLERVLRGAFCGLIGSKYAVVTASRMQALTLIEDCRSIAKVHTGIAAAKRQTLIEILNACERANAKRNRVIHDTWAMRPGDVIVTLHSQRKSHEVTVTARTVDELHVLANEIATAADGLLNALAAALGPQSILIEDELRRELGHDITADSGLDG